MSRQGEKNERSNPSEARVRSAEGGQGERRKYQGKTCGLVHRSGAGAEMSRSWSQPARNQMVHQKQMRVRIMRVRRLGQIGSSTSSHVAGCGTHHFPSPYPIQWIICPCLSVLPNTCCCPSLMHFSVFRLIGECPAMNTRNTDSGTEQSKIL